MSDHISGPRALADPIADITDVYAFPSPERPGPSGAGAKYAAVRAGDGEALRWAPLPLPAARGAPGRGRDGPAPYDVHDSEEFVFDCVFSDPAETAPGQQEGTCYTPAGDTVEFEVDDEQGGAAHGCARSPACGGIRSSWTPRRC